MDFYFYFSNCSINPNPTYLPKHQPLSPNHQFSQRIWYRERCSVHAHMAWGQEFRKSKNFSWHRWFSLQRCCKTLFLLTSVVQNVCVCTMYFVSAGKNTLLLYVTVCEKVVPRLNEHHDVIEWNFMKIAPPPKWRAGCAPDHIWCHVNISEVATPSTGINDPELLVQSRESRSRSAPLFRHKGWRVVERHFSCDS